MGMDSKYIASISLSCDLTDHQLGNEISLYGKLVALRLCTGHTRSEYGRFGIVSNGVLYSA